MPLQSLPNLRSPTSGGTAIRRARRGRFLRLLLAFLAILVGLDFFVRRHARDLHPWDSRGLEAKAWAFERTAPETIVLTGSSRAACGFHPEEFAGILGRPVFNLGISATKPFEWKMLCRDYLKGRRPDLVVLGVNANEVSGVFQPAEAAATLMTAKDVLRYTLDEEFNPRVIGTYAQASFGRAWALFGHRYAIRLWVDEQLGRVHAGFGAEARLWRKRNGLRDAPDGFDHPWLAGQSMRNLAQRLKDNPNSVNFFPGTFDENNPSMRYFKETLDELIAWKMPVVVAYIPNSPLAQSRWPGVEARGSAVLARVCAERGVPYFDVRLDLTNDDFFDETHLALPAARRLSRAIAERIRDLDTANGPLLATGRQP